MEGRAPTTMDDESGTAESDYNDDPLISGPTDPITMPIELSFLGTGRRIALTALLDLGCAQCLISPHLFRFT